MDNVDNAEEQQQELEALEAFYGVDAFRNLQNSPIISFDFNLDPIDSETNYVEALLHVELPADYPASENPQIALSARKGLSKNQLDWMQHLADQIAEENVGCQTIISVVETLKEWLTENNQSEHTLMLQRQPAVAAEKNKPRIFSDTALNSCEKPESAFSLRSKVASSPQVEAARVCQPRQTAKSKAGGQDNHGDTKLVPASAELSKEALLDLDAEQPNAALALQTDEGVSVVPGISRAQAKHICRELQIPNKLLSLINVLDSAPDAFEGYFTSHLMPRVAPPFHPITRTWLLEAVDCNRNRNSKRGVDAISIGLHFTDGHTRTLKVLRKATVSDVKRLIGKYDGFGVCESETHCESENGADAPDGFGIVLYVLSFGGGVQVTDETAMDSPLDASATLVDLGLTDGAELVVMADPDGSLERNFRGVDAPAVAPSAPVRRVYAFNPKVSQELHQHQVAKARHERMATRKADADTLAQKMKEEQRANKANTQKRRASRLGKRQAGEDGKRGAK
jgi:hypothetical protein